MIELVPSSQIPKAAREQPEMRDSVRSVHFSFISVPPSIGISSYAGPLDPIRLRVFVLPNLFLRPIIERDNLVDRRKLFGGSWTSRRGTFGVGAGQRNGAVRHPAGSSTVGQINRRSSFCGSATLLLGSAPGQLSNGIFLWTVESFLVGAGRRAAGRLGSALATEMELFDNQQAHRRSDG